jgi:amidase
MNKVLFIISIIILITYKISFAGTISSQKDISFFIEEATIQSIHTAIKNHQMTCEQLINAYLDRIKKYNLTSSKKAPINAFTEINQNVMDQARRLDDIYARTQKLSGSLHCIPVVLKDNIDSYDSTTTSGTLALLGNQSSKDAFLVSQLRQAGAIILGKGSMDELASGMFGISSRSGRVGNAYDSDKSPGGSSGGPAAAVSANFAMIGIGTDNSGSVRIPAAFNGVYGLRPSTGLISQNGIFPAGNLDGTAGPLARSVEDLVAVLDIITKADPTDKKTVTVPRIKTYTVYLNKNGLNGKRIGIVHRVGTIDTFKAMPVDIILIFKQSLQKMKQAGATIIDDITLPKFINNLDLNMSGMRQDVDAYLSSYPAVRKNFYDICESNRTRVFGDVNQCVKFITAMPVKFGRKYKQALEIFNKNKIYVEKIMAENHLDALLIPISRTGSATYDAYKVNTWLAPVSSNSGLPAITINLGFTHSDKMPIGVELIGKQYAEGTLIEIAYSSEKNSDPRIVPTMLEENDVFNKLDIPAYNNLLTVVGYKSYIEVLIKSKSNQVYKDLTPTIFGTIVRNESANVMIRRLGGSS